MEVEFVARRTNEDTVAIVKACVMDPDMEYFPTFLNTLSAALTDWMRETDEGMDAWEGSCEDFNVGDLAVHQEDTFLRTYLSKHGIEQMVVKTFGGHDYYPWVFDTILVDHHDLKKSRRRKNGT